MTAPATAPDLILHRGLFTTLDRANPTASAVAITDGKFTAVGRDHEVIPLAGERTRIIDLKGKRVLPGLIDNHLHIIRGGLNFNMELRWDGVRSLAEAMAMLKRQVEITPPPQWVRVVGGFTEHQFAEKRLPTLDEINAAAPETPVFILHLYDRALLNKAALRAVGYTAETPVPPGGEMVLDSYDNPTGLLLAKPNAGILYAALAKGPKLPFDYQLNSTRHFMRELNRLGVTGAIDAGGGSQNYPEDYAVIEKLAAEGQLTVRIAYNLFTQKPKGEKDDFLNWTKTSKYQQGTDYFRHNGGGEMLVFSAADFEDFRQPRPDMPAEMGNELEEVVRILVQNRWPWRLHATYDETISRALDAFERVNQDIPIDGLHWFIDHAETISDRSIERIAALGGGIAVQHRMAYQGEYFVERYGPGAAEATPPIARMLRSGIPVSAGTDATRVASYNRWVALAWLVTGKTVGGLRLYPVRNRLDREAALRMWTENVTWFSNEEGKKGRIEVGKLADLVVPDHDYFACSEDEIAGIAADLTIVGGNVVWRRGLCRPRRSRATAGDARLVARPAVWRVCRLGRPLRCGRGSGSAVACRHLQLCEPLRHPWTRSRRRPFGPAAGQRSAVLLGRAWVQLLRILIRGVWTPVTRAIEMQTSLSTKANGVGSAWSPFQYTTFTVLWVATVLSNIGSWMQNAAAGWLMTSLSPEPFTVALVQAATTLPMFLFSLPAGALADIVDRRCLLIVMQVAAVAIAALFAIFVWLGWITPSWLLTFISLSGIATVLTMPAWQAIVPQLVPKEELRAAVALNGVGFNISRAIGPALAGLAVGALGMAAPYWINALSTLVVIAALIWWRRPEPFAQFLPAERFVTAIRSGLRYARYNPDLRATLIRCAGFFPLASVYWALLPLLVRNRIAGGPETYGILLGAIGAGAVGGAFALPAAARLGADRVVAGATVGTALALALFAIAREPETALIACVFAGISWVGAIATLNVSAQFALPGWVRGRGMAMFATVQFAGLAVGSIVWGQAAQMIGLPAVHIIAAIALVASVPLLRRWKLQTAAGLDLAPSMHWPAPLLSHDIEPDRGPVLVTIEYVVVAVDRAAFLAAMAELASERRRDGAYDWGIYEDTAQEGAFVETFYIDSWLEHMRQHQRVTNADRVLQDAVHSFHAKGAPAVRHLIAAQESEK